MMNTGTSSKVKLNSVYGTEHNGKLRTVIVHTPVADQTKTEESEPLPDPVNSEESQCIQEHVRLCMLLQEYGVTVFQLKELVDVNSDIIALLPDLTLIGNSAVVSGKGAFLSRRSKSSRKPEEFVIKEALQQLSIPVIFEFFNNYEYFEGFVPFDKKTVFVTTTVNHENDSVIQFIQHALIYFEEVIHIDVPNDQRFDTATSVFNKIRSDCAMIFPDAIVQTTIYRRYHSNKTDIVDYCKKRGIDYILISDAEQLRHACSFISIDNERIIQFDSVFDDTTKWMLSQKKVNVLPFHSEYLCKRSGSLSCFLLPLHRESVK